MNVTLMPAEKEERAVLENLLQFYIYDFSEIMGADVERTGRFADKPLGAYWEDDWRHPFVLRSGGHLAGFALVHHRSRVSDDPDTWDMAEFFVLRKYRRQGLGAFAAKALFTRYRGRWEIRQTKENHAATAFWRRVVSEFSGGQFDEVVLDDARWRGPMQSFVSR